MPGYEKSRCEYDTQIDVIRLYYVICCKLPLCVLPLYVRTVVVVGIESRAFRSHKRRERRFLNVWSSSSTPKLHIYSSSTCIPTVCTVPIVLRKCTYCERGSQIYTCGYETPLPTLDLCRCASNHIESVLIVENAFFVVLFSSRVLCRIAS